MDYSGSPRQYASARRGRIALLQNQSEMRHNAWADARRQISRLDYECVLFTSGTIGDLQRSLTGDRFAALVIGSNAFNDRTIRAAVATKAFRRALGLFLEDGRGVVILHQMGMVRDGSRLDFLPAPWNSVSLKHLRDGQEATIVLSEGAERHAVLNFPEVIDPERIVEHAKRYSPLRASWFHSWSGVDQDTWTPLLRGPEREQALVALARDPDGRRRIVLCAPPADWQRPPALLPNLLYYACHGSQPAAIIGREGENAGLELVQIWLASERIPFKHYEPDQLTHLAERLRDGVHATVLLAPSVNPDELGDNVRYELERGVADGRLRVLGFGQPLAGRRRLWSVSSQLTVADAIQPLQAQAIVALAGGRVDDSFWSTVETLDALDGLQPLGAPDVDADMAAPAIAEAKKHHLRDDGSYDSTPAATCGLLWLLDRFGDPEDAEPVERWLRGVVEGEPTDAFAGEAIMALTTFRRTGRERPDDRARLEELLTVAPPPENLRELDLLAALHAAEIYGLPQHASPLARELIERQDAENGGWIDLETTATVVARLAALDGDAEVPKTLEHALLRASLHIRDAAKLDRTAPWGDRVSTSLLCVRALTLVNERLDIPIGDTVDAVRQGHHTAEFRNAGEAAARAAQSLRVDIGELSVENEKLTVDNQDLRDKVKSAQEDATKALKTSEDASKSVRRLEHWRIWLSVSLAAAVYLSVAIVVGAVHSHAATLGQLVDGVGDGAPVHVAALLGLAGIGVALEQVVKPK